jgi:hypothetical protein
MSGVVGENRGDSDDKDLIEELKIIRYFLLLFIIGITMVSYKTTRNRNVRSKRPKRQSLKRRNRKSRKVPRGARLTH